MNNKITFRQVLTTIHADLIGKDSHRGITLTYGWFANQVGHFALGFIPVSLMHVFGCDLFNSLLIVSAFWLLFEIYNASSPLYKKEYKGNGSFKPHWSNLTFDTFTDLCFFWLGSVTYFFCATENLNKIYIWILIVCLIGLFFSIRYWFLTKLYQQNAFFPYQFRLSQWNGFIRPNDIQLIIRFLKESEEGRHFLVFGVKKSGKTTLTVGIANELSIRHKKSTYTTFSKWVSLIQDSTNELKRGNRSLWSWLDSNFLLIDDINPGDPCEANKFTSADVLGYIETSLYSERNIEALKTKNVAWVVGKCSESESPENWRDMLIKLGVSPEKISMIYLYEDN